MKRISDEVFYSDETVIELCAGDIKQLKDVAAKASRRKSRICAHKSPDDRVHEMVIVHAKDTYVRPHKHIGKSESFHVIEGTGRVVLFDNEGKIARVVELGDSRSGRTFYYRLDEPAYHTLIIDSDIIVFHETTVGPFNREDTVFAPWSPEDTDEAGKNYFLSKLRTALDEKAAGKRVIA